MKRVRGRPRQYHPDQALDAAMHVFWAKGLTGTSLDDLCDAMGMNRPSIYNAFGDKQTIYRRALARFAGQLDLALGALLGGGADVRADLKRFFAGALDVYYAAEPAHGCLVMCTAPVEALAHPEVGDDLRGVIARIDRALTRRLRAAQAAGGLAPDIDCLQAARTLQALLHSAALRARAGEPRRALEGFIRFGCRAVLGG
ncbi:MAG: TetR/AcrR family transcriptional regulator [bacterium]